MRTLAGMTFIIALVILLMSGGTEWPLNRLEFASLSTIELFMGCGIMVLRLRSISTKLLGTLSVLLALGLLAYATESGFLPYRLSLMTTLAVTSLLLFVQQGGVRIGVRMLLTHRMLETS